MKYSILIFGLFIAVIGSGQVTLTDAIKYATDNSEYSDFIVSGFKKSELENLAFRKNYRPYLFSNGNIPSFNKDNFAVVQPDGTVNFLGRSQDNSYLNLGISQPLYLTGGTISLNTDLTRHDDLMRKSIRYNGTPFFIKLSQPLFGFNKLKWDKKIEPIKLREATFKYREDMEELKYEICRLFFRVIEAQENQRLAQVNLENSITNLSIEKRKTQIGTSTEDKVNYFEIRKLVNEQQVEEYKSTVKKNLLVLRSAIKSDDTGVVQLQLPETLPAFNLNTDNVLSLAKSNLSSYISFERERFEALRNISDAKSKGRQINLTASYGLNNAENTIPAIYKNPNNQQRFNIGFSIPIFDWGRTKTGVEIAKIEQTKTDIANKIEEAKLITEITNLVSDMDDFKRNVARTLSIDTLSLKRYNAINRLYQLGRANLLELQAAQVEKDQARRNYVMALRQFWETYYLLKTKTVVDF